MGHLVADGQRLSLQVPHILTLQEVALFRNQRWRGHFDQHWLMRNLHLPSWVRADALHELGDVAKHFELNANAVGSDHVALVLGVPMERPALLHTPFPYAEHRRGRIQNQCSHLLM